jgi:hypothetical protein
MGKLGGAGWMGSLDSLKAAAFSRQALPDFCIYPKSNGLGRFS